MLARIGMLMALCCTAAICQPLSFDNVRLYERPSPEKKPKRIEGDFTLDRNSGVLIFTVRNRPYVTIAYNTVTNLTYDEGESVLTVQFKDDHGRGQFNEFEVGTNKYNYLLSSLEAHTGVRVTRISKR